MRPNVSPRQRSLMGENPTNNSMAFRIFGALIHVPVRSRLLLINFADDDRATVCHELVSLSSETVSFRRFLSPPSTAVPLALEWTMCEKCLPMVQKILDQDSQIWRYHFKERPLYFY